MMKSLRTIFWGGVFCLAGCGGPDPQPTSEPLEPHRFSPIAVSILDGFLQAEAGGFRGTGAAVFPSPFVGETGEMEVHLSPGGWVQLFVDATGELKEGVSIGFRREPGSGGLQVLLQTRTQSQNLSLDFGGVSGSAPLRFALQLSPTGTLRVDWDGGPTRFYATPGGSGDRWGFRLDGAYLNLRP